MTTTARNRSTTPCPLWCVHPHQPGATAHESEPVKWTPDEVSNTDLPFEVCLVVDPDWGNTEMLYLSVPGYGLTSIADARKLATNSTLLSRRSWSAGGF